MTPRQPRLTAAATVTKLKTIATTGIQISLQSAAPILNQIVNCSITSKIMTVSKKMQICK